MRRVTVLLVAVLLGVPTWAAAVADAEPGELLTLDQALAIAKKQNRQVATAKLSVGQWSDHIASQRTQMLPHFDVSITPSYVLTPLNLTFPVGAFGTYPATGPIPGMATVVPTSAGYSTTASASVAQPLTGIYVAALAVDQLSVGAEMSKEDLRNQQQTTVNSVRQAYYGVLQAESTLSDAREQVVSWNEVVKVVGQQSAVQAVQPPAVLQSKAGLAQAEYNVRVASHTLDNRKEQLNYQLGRDPATTFHTSPAVADTAVETDLNTARETALGQRPELRKAKLNVDYNDYNVSLKWAAFIPSVNLVVKYLAPITSDVLPKNILYAGVQFDWDVFDWGGKLYDIDQMKKGVQQAKLAVSDTEAQVLLNVNSTFRALEDARSYLQVAELSRDAARAQLTLTQRDYAQQTALLKDLLSAQASLAAASDQYRQALLGLLDAQASFDKALGSGD